SDMHAAVGTMRSKTSRGDGTDHLRYRRHRCCDGSDYPCLRADFRALWGARVLGNGGSLCRGIAARPNSARADRGSRVIVSLSQLLAALLVGPPLSARVELAKAVGDFAA